MTRDVLFRLRIPVDVSILRGLLRINLQAHCEYMEANHPGYARRVCAPLRRTLWRIGPRF